MVGLKSQSSPVLLSILNSSENLFPFFKSFNHISIPKIPSLNRSIVLTSKFCKYFFSFFSLISRKSPGSDFCLCNTLHKEMSASFQSNFHHYSATCAAYCHLFLFIAYKLRSHQTVNIHLFYNFRQTPDLTPTSKLQFPY